MSAFNPFAFSEVKPLASPLAELAKEYKMLPDRVLNSSVEKSGFEVDKLNSKEKDEQIRQDDALENTDECVVESDDGTTTDSYSNDSQEINEDNPRSIKTINDELVGQKHPETGVPYVEKEVVTDTGEKVKGVFPQFDSIIDVQLPEDMELTPDRIQFAECNKQLAERVAKDPELRAQFTEDQLADIEDGYTPEGYTWHHNEEKGEMQLVDSDIHSQTRHTGGRNIWGGGTENRH